VEDPVELPFTIVFEPPSQTELRDALRMRGTWVAGIVLSLAIGAIFVIWGVPRGDAAASVVRAPLTIASRPSNAQVWLDGREQGRTPLQLEVTPGTHTVQLTASQALDVQYVVQVGDAGAVLDAVLWRRQPALMRLRPTLPGAALSDVRLLSDGTLSLGVDVPPRHQLQAWRLDPDSGALEELLSHASGTRVVVAPDGLHAAVLGFEIGPPAIGSLTAERASVLWLVSAERATPVASWRLPTASDEQLLDASWSPRAERLLVVTGQVRSGGGAARSRVWLVEADGQAARTMLSLPSQIVTGSVLWSPDGQRVVFLAHAGAVNAVCLLDLEENFRYIADLDLSPGSPLAYPPATWSTDGQQLLLVAPRQLPPGAPVGWLPAEPRHALYVVRAADLTPRLLGDTEFDLAGWREDGQVLGLGRLGMDGSLALRLQAGGGGSPQQLELPLKPGPGYAATWDLAHARVLVAKPAPSGGVEYWLAVLGAEDRS
jgi:PEGA domain